MYRREVKVLDKKKENDEKIKKAICFKQPNLLGDYENVPPNRKPFLQSLSDERVKNESEANINKPNGKVKAISGDVWAAFGSNSSVEKHGEAKIYQIKRNIGKSSHLENCSEELLVKLQSKHDANEKLQDGEGPCGYLPSLQAFPQRSELKANGRKPTGSGFYKCSKCPKAFKNISNAEAHELMHNDGMPFACGARSYAINGDQKPYRPFGGRLN